LAVLVSMTYGFHATLGGGALAYGLACLTIATLSRTASRRDESTGETRGSVERGAP
jgi:hypothetical protein